MGITDAEIERIRRAAGLMSTDTVTFRDLERIVEAGRGLGHLPVMFGMLRLADGTVVLRFSYAYGLHLTSRVFSEHSVWPYPGLSGDEGVRAAMEWLTDAMHRLTEAFEKHRNV